MDYSRAQARRGVLVYVTLACGLSWTVLLVFLAAGGRWNTLASLPAAAVYMVMPAASALIVQRLIHRRRIRKPLGIFFKPNRWFVVAWLLPPVLSVAALGASLLLPAVRYSPDMTGLFDRFRAALTPEQIALMRSRMEATSIHPFWLALAQGLAAGVTVNAVLGFGEELGWRGFLQGELGSTGFYRSSLVVGSIWGFWHFPIILLGHNYAQHPVAGVFMMIGWTTLLAPLFAYVRIRSGSVIAASIFHGSINGTAGLSLMLLEGGSDLTVGILGLPGFGVLALANGVLVLYDRLVEPRPIIFSGRQAGG